MNGPIVNIGIDEKERTPSTVNKRALHHFSLDFEGKKFIS